MRGPSRRAIGSGDALARRLSARSRGDGLYPGPAPPRNRDFDLERLGLVNGNQRVVDDDDDQRILDDVGNHEWHGHDDRQHDEWHHERELHHHHDWRQHRAGWSMRAGNGVVRGSLCGGGLLEGAASLDVCLWGCRFRSVRPERLLPLLLLRRVRCRMPLWLQLPERRLLATIGILRLHHGAVSFRASVHSVRRLPAGGLRQHCQPRGGVRPRRWSTTIPPAQARCVLRQRLHRLSTRS
jgi:hypothetical protein